MPEYLSHIRDDGQRESVATHLHEVADMAAEFAASLGLDQWAYAAGAYHDIGKYSTEFQHRICDGGPKVDHSTAGAYELAQRGLWPISYCVAGHHGGLPDGGTEGDMESTLSGRLSKVLRSMEGQGSFPDYTAFKEECFADIDNIVTPSIHAYQNIDDSETRAEMQRFSISFLIRMLFSCLVDADYLCTERFMKGQGRPSLASDDIGTLCKLLEERKLANFFPPQGELNRYRCEVLEECAAAAGEDPGIYSLTVPTGGGKTLASMRFALNHARLHGMRRVIYAEPYTSIIEQNAAVYRDIFGENNVLESHSNVNFDGGAEGGGQDDDPFSHPLRLAAENWDMPVIVTTNVQLFESLFASSTSRCRKLHNIAGSVIVLDEAQMIPTKFLQPCLYALAELVMSYGCTVVLCTATQPALDTFFERLGLPVREITSDTVKLFDVLARVSYSNLGEINDASLASSLAGHSQALCIVNSRKQARNVYELLAGQCNDDEAYHLTTLMHPKHREKTLRMIRTRLRERKPCRVVATSLVEAGVDLDFPTVYRSMAGLDSIVQAAGRCNRENTRPATESRVYVFSPVKAPGIGYALPEEVRQRADVTVSAVPQAGRAGDLDRFDSLENINAFFNRLYFYKGERALDGERVISRLTHIVPVKPGEGLAFYSIPFREVASSFHLIDDLTSSIIIPEEDVREELHALQEGFATRDDMRRLGHYSVNVYRQDLNVLIGAGVVSPIATDLYVLTDESCYSDTEGLNTKVEQGRGSFW